LEKIVAASSDEILQGALAALQSGNAADAERLFKELLQAEPNHPAGLNLLAIALMQLGRLDESAHYLQCAITANAASDVTFYNYGIVLKALGRAAEALDSFGQSLAVNPGVAETWNFRGAVLNDLNRYDDAIADFDRAIAINGAYADAFLNKGKSLGALKRPDDALGALDRATTFKPDLVEAWLVRGRFLFDLGRYGDALAAYDRALAFAPGLVEAWLGRGTACVQLGYPDEASTAYDRVLNVKPDLAEAWLARGTLNYDRSRYDDALADYDKALALTPDMAEAWQGRGIVLAKRNEAQNALAAYDKAMALNPDLAEAWLGRGNVQTTLEQYDDALAAFDRALTLKPALAEAWHGRSIILGKLGRHSEALPACEKALELNRGFAAAWHNRGNILAEIKQYTDALAAYNAALALKPDFAEAWHGRALALAAFSQYREALAASEEAVKLAPDLAEAWAGLGDILMVVSRHREAFAAFDKALAIKPGLRNVEGSRLFAKMHLCNWTDLDTDIEHLLKSVRAGQAASVPFAFLSVPSTPEEQLQCAKRYIADLPQWPRLQQRSSTPHKRIRVAYLSADLHEHATAHLTAGLFEEHDKSRFEVTAISFGPDDNSALRGRLKNAFERFVDVRSKNEQDIAELIKDLEIDIAVDLKGFTVNERISILARRPAPVQVSYLGYAGTMAADFYDYVIADRHVIPQDQFAFYSEKVVWLPDTYQVNDSQRRIAERTPTRSGCGLPENAFVFCNFNNSFKITPEVFHAWMRLLKGRANSVLWLIDSHGSAAENLRRECAASGVSPDRLVFAEKMPPADHLARHRQADLFLDTLPYNAHTTTSDALWAGLPVLTCVGPAFAGRVAASLLHAVGLPELVTGSLADYEALASQIAADPSLCASLKGKLAGNRESTALFDTKRFTRNIEAAYTTMHERHRQGEPPQSFAVDQA
jgi:protein O-GlcNAc transferase